VAAVIAVAIEPNRATDEKVAIDDPQPAPAA
jgi:hypothetical protein